jgi:hypothetical protein
LVRSSLYKLHRMDDKEHSCLTPLPVYSLLVSHWSSCTEHFGLCKVCWWIFFRFIRHLYSLVPALVWSTLQGHVPSASILSRHAAPYQCPKYFQILFSAFQLHPQFLFLC